jgi:predicted DNA binding CopG/RHH family protein
MKSKAVVYSIESERRRSTMTTKAKLEGNARYLSKFKTVSIRIPEEEFPAVAAAATGEGLALSAYVLEAIREKVRGNGETLPSVDD